MKLHIKNMVSLRCKLMVEAELEKLGIEYTSVELGEAEISQNISMTLQEELKTSLRKVGLDLIHDPKSILVEKIKSLIIEMIHFDRELPKMNYSDYISQKLNYNYCYLANLFSERNGTSIREFIIAHKIERAKELFLYQQLTFSEIVWRLHYSSLPHLSAQFKKVTGLTPSLFKKMKQKKLVALENL